MAKQFTQIPLNDYDQVKVKSLQDNRDAAISEFNGALDGQNLPVTTINSSHIKEPILIGSITSSYVENYVSYETQGIHKYEVNTVTTLGNDIWTPAASLNMQSDEWRKGFNRLEVFGTPFNDFSLDFDAMEGMLVGSATVDWEHGTTVYQVQVSSDPALFNGMSRGHDWWTEWGVFVNNVLVARTGNIFPRRHTTKIPFSVPCGSQPISVDVRFIGNSWRPQDAPAASAKWSTDFNIYSANVICRNVYR
jgi:hypothetical protein